MGYRIPKPSDKKVWNTIDVVKGTVNGRAWEKAEKSVISFLYKGHVCTQEIADLDDLIRCIDRANGVEAEILTVKAAF